MNVHHLIKLANNIGSFFESEPDRAKAVQGVVTHIRNYWEPRMRRRIFEYLDEQNGEGLSELVLEALKTQRESLMPRESKLHA
jgi:formate dehydrogenase subunit delta